MLPTTFSIRLEQAAQCMPLIAALVTTRLFASVAIVITILQIPGRELKPQPPTQGGKMFN
jgi:hypothetical protein